MTDPGLRGCGARWGSSLGDPRGGPGRCRSEDIVRAFRRRHRGRKLAGMKNEIASDGGGVLRSDWRIAESGGRAVAEMRSDRGWEPILHVEPDGEVEISLTAGGEYGQLTA